LFFRRVFSGMAVRHPRARNSRFALQGFFPYRARQLF
jgi:hypothetical protein